MPRPSLPRVAAAFLARGVLEASRYRAAFALSLCGMLAGMLAFYYLAAFVRPGADLRAYGGYFGFLVVGMVGLDLFTAVVGAAGRRVREAQLAGTLDGLLSTPTPDAWVVGCLPAWDVCAALGRAAVYLGAAALLFHAPLRVHAASLPLALALALASFLPLALLGAALTLALRRGDPLAFFLGMVSSVFGGVLYPLDALPAWGRALALALPLTHALEALRGALLRAASPADLARPLAALALLALLLTPLGLGALTYALRRAREDGSLGQY